MNRTIVDTGPLVALFNQRDRWHRWVSDQMKTLAPPLLTCEPVITEACFLIRKGGGSPDALVEKLGPGRLEVALDLQAEAQSVRALMQRYSSTPMSLADACLVRLSERYPECRVFTLDDDFTHYRRHGRQVIPLIFPSG